MTTSLRALAIVAVILIGYLLGFASGTSTGVPPPPRLQQPREAEPVMAPAVVTGELDDPERADRTHVPVPRPGPAAKSRIRGHIHGAPITEEDYTKLTGFGRMLVDHAEENSAELECRYYIEMLRDSERRKDYRITTNQVSDVDRLARQHLPDGRLLTEAQKSELTELVQASDDLYLEQTRDQKLLWYEASLEMMQSGRAIEIPVGDTAGATRFEAQYPVNKNQTWASFTSTATHSRRVVYTRAMFPMLFGVMDAEHKLREERAAMIAEFFQRLR